MQRGLPTPYLLRNFNQIGDAWQLNEQLRSKVSFRQLNLLSDFSSLGRFDVILCRNVLIYFDAARKSDILSRMSRQLAGDGFLVLGASESLIGLQTNLNAHPEHRGIFVNGAPGARSDVATMKPAAKLDPMPASAMRPAAAAMPGLRIRTAT